MLVEIFIVVTPAPVGMYIDSSIDISSIPYDTN